MCTFPITINGSTATFVEKAQQKVVENGGSFQGNGNTATFSVPLPLGQEIRGNYVLNGQEIVVNITHKPFVIGCGRIEEFVKMHI
jgi:hypothetical protein